MHAERAERGDDEDAAVEPGPRDRQQLDPEADERQVEHQQHRVADVQAGDHAPHQRRFVFEQQRARLQAELLKRREQDGGGRRRRQAEREQRHQRARGRCVVGGFGAGHRFDRAAAEFLRPLREPLLDRVRHQRRQLGAAGGQRAERKADRRAAQPRLPRSPPLLGGHPRATREPAALRRSPDRGSRSTTFRRSRTGRSRR